MDGQGLKKKKTKLTKKKKKNPALSWTEADSDIITHIK